MLQRHERKRLNLNTEQILCTKLLLTLFGITNNIAKQQLQPGFRQTSCYRLIYLIKTRNNIQTRMALTK